VAEAPLLELRSVSLAIGAAPILVDVSFAIGRGEIVGLVGESGSGKTMTARAVINALPDNCARGGMVLFEGEAVGAMTAERLRAIRSRAWGVIFQDARRAVDPLFTIEDYLTEGLRARQGMERAPARVRAAELLGQVGIRDGARRLGQYPYQMSGGMLQRVVIAGALAGNPSLIIADEPTTALDVTTQAEIVAIFASLRRERGLAMLFITHDLGLAAALCDRILVMYAGRIVEVQPSAGIFAAPAHPYTQALVAARPSLSERTRRLPMIPGAPTGAATAPAGCPFHQRCRFAIADCREAEPPLRPAGDALSACLRALEIRDELRL
jgi:peptide/nickel transport system ATP-binding protein